MYHAAVYSFGGDSTGGSKRHRQIQIQAIFDVLEGGFLSTIRVLGLTEGVLFVIRRSG